MHIIFALAVVCLAWLTAGSQTGLCAFRAGSVLLEPDTQFLEVNLNPPSVAIAHQESVITIACGGDGFGLLVSMRPAASPEACFRFIDRVTSIMTRQPTDDLKALMRRCHQTVVASDKPVGQFADHTEASAGLVVRCQARKGPSGTVQISVLHLRPLKRSWPWS